MRSKTISLLLFLATAFFFTTNASAQATPDRYIENALAALTKQSSEEEVKKVMAEVVSKYKNNDQILAKFYYLLKRKIGDAHGPAIAKYFVEAIGDANRINKIISLFKALGGIDRNLVALRVSPAGP